MASSRGFGGASEDDELQKRGYSVGQTLGEGSYAKVKSAFADHIGHRVALKIINRKRAPKDFQQKFLPRELEVMRTLNHPNTITLYDVMQFNNKVSHCYHILCNLWQYFGQANVSIMWIRRT